jgi:hypothetical protein
MTANGVEGSHGRMLNPVGPGRQGRGNACYNKGINAARLTYACTSVEERSLLDPYAIRRAATYLFKGINRPSREGQ